MPSRKSDSSDKTDSRRSSLRRLSSIASFTTLNPFSRRRSNNNVPDTPSSTSNASLTSLTANPPVPPKGNLSTLTLGDNLSSPSAPTRPPHQPLSPEIPPRKSSYICLPDDPIGGMPRSRTFSNLPLPARNKKPSTASLAQSKSYARLPSDLLPSTRLPSPRMSTRKHSITRLVPIDHNVAHTRNRLPRSDTEPLLQAITLERSDSLLPRSTAFKENITMSPVRRLPSPELIENKGLCTSRLPSRSSVSTHDWAEPSQRRRSMLSTAYTTNSSTLSLSRYAAPLHGGHKRPSCKYDSSPAYRSSRDRPPTPGQAVQRWNSQPLLTSETSNKRASPHGEIKQNRLMSARQAPTPPPPKTPLGSMTVGPASLKSPKDSSQSYQVSEPTPLRVPDPYSTRVRANSARTNARTVHSTEPLAYWTGRFSTLNDKYRNEDLLASMSILSSSQYSTAGSSRMTRSETDRMHSADANLARMRRAVEYLYTQCANDEARQSFFRWQRQLASALSMPDLGRPVQGVKNCALEMSLHAEEQIAEPMSASRKVTFIDRLLGKKQKILGSVT